MKCEMDCEKSGTTYLVDCTLVGGTEIVTQVAKGLCAEHVLQFDPQPLKCKCGCNEQELQP